MENGFREERWRKGDEGLSFLFVGNLQHVHILSNQNKNRNGIWQPGSLNLSLQTMTQTLVHCGCFGPSESLEVQILLACLSRNKHQGKHPNKWYLQAFFLISQRSTVYLSEAVQMLKANTDASLPSPSFSSSSVEHIVLSACLWNAELKQALPKTL